MISIRRTFTIGIVAGASVLAAHALTYLLVAVLPDPSIILLGFQSAQESVLSAFQQQTAIRGYGQVLFDLANGDLGKTLDGVPVTAEVWTALEATVPRVVAAFAGVLMVVLAVAFLPRPGNPAVWHGLTLTSFLPPFLIPFACLVLALAMDLAIGTEGLFDTGWWLTVVAMAVSPAALAGAQTANIMKRNLEEPFAKTVLASGATPIRQRRRLLHNLFVELAPGLEKMLTAMITATMFAEPILGETGFGTMVVRAIRRTDVDLLLASVLAAAIAINLGRVAGVSVRALYRVPQR